MPTSIKQRSFKRIVKRTVLVFTVFTLLFLHFYAPRFITEIKNPLIEWWRTNPNFEKGFLVGKKIEFTTKDGLLLKANLTFSQLDTTKATLILVHGIRSQKEHFIALSKKLSEIGFTTVAVDLRAHGESEGQHCTFGVKEKNDISSLIDYLIETEKTGSEIGIWGQSLGGAVSLQAMGVDKRIKFGIIESTFSDFRKITNDYFAYFLGFSFEFLTDYLINRAGSIAEFDPDSACPGDYCKNITQPIIMVHGDDDKKINIDYGRSNFANLKSENKEFLVIEKGTHLNIWEIGGDAYFNKITSFIEKHIKN